MANWNVPQHPLDQTGIDREDAIAVALAFDADRDSAPRIVAGGRGCIAEQILNVAEAHGIEVHRDDDLVQLLSAVDINSEIPVEAFVAVAEILSYIYRTNGRLPE